MAMLLGLPQVTCCTAYLQTRVQAERAAALGAKIKAGKLRAKLERTERRARAGVCPCCSRTFQQLQRHMAAKHPAAVPKARKA